MTAKLLIMEDDVDFAFSLRTQLESAGHDVYWARNAQDSIDLLQEQDVDLLITDVHVTKDGRVVADGGVKLVGYVRLHHRIQTLPIIGITGVKPTQYAPDYLGIMRSIGADFTLAKPFDPPEIIDLVQRALQVSP